MHIKLQKVVCLLAASLLPLASFAGTSSDLRLVEAVKNQNKDAVNALLKQHVDVNIPQGDGATALAWAAHWGDPDTVDLLIGAGSNVNAANDLGVSPLYLACASGNATIAEKLLTAGANPSAAAATGVSPLMEASRAGSVETVQALLAHGANVNAKENSAGQTALMWAVAERHPEVVRALVEHGADVNARSNTSSLLIDMFVGEAADNAYGPSKVVQEGGSTPLLFAARQGCVECARILLDAGANVNDTAPDGNSALVLAAHSGQGAVGMLLLERGANPNTDGAGYTALHAAVLRGDPDLVKALLAHGANPNARFSTATKMRREGPDYSLPVPLVGGTPFLLAARYASVDIMRALVANGADPKLTAANDTTPLMAVAGARPRALQRYLDPTPLKEAQILEAVKAALDIGGSDVNAVDQNGNTALHIAASRGYDSIVQLLADKGAKLDVKNKRGQTPLALTLARPKGGAEGQPRYKSTADLLRKLGATE